MTNLTGAKYPKPIQDRCLLYPKRVKHVPGNRLNGSEDFSRCTNTELCKLCT